MGRREELEALLKALYSIDIQNDFTEDTVRLFAERNRWEPATLDKVLSIMSKRETIDGYLSRHLKKWSISRIAVIDRNILRIGIYELLYELQTPMKVIINEAIEIAKKYGTKDSFMFINAELDAVAKEINRTL